MLGSILVADHPEGDHRVRISRRSDTDLEHAVAGREERSRRLLLADDEPVSEVELPDRAPTRPGELAGLERRDTDLTVELGRPGRLIRIDAEAERPVAHLVAGCGRRPRAPVRQVMRQPQPWIQLRAVEAILDDQLSAGDVEEVGRSVDGHGRDPARAYRPSGSSGCR